MLEIIKGQLNIAIIDDVESQAEFIATIVRRNLPESSSVVVFTDPLEALKEISTGKYFAVFTDIHMENIKGDDLIRQINEMDLGVQSYVLTSDEGLILAINCFRLGARKIFLKPPKMADLKTTVGAIQVDFQQWRTTFTSLQKMAKKAS